MLHTVAKLHYEADLSQVEIARRLQLSAATISRLLRRAREEGIVRIEIVDPVSPEEIEERLVQRLGLRRALVIDAPEAGTLASLAAPVGTMLKERGLGQGGVLAIGWGRAVRAVIQSGLPRLPGVVTVPANGAMQETAEHFQINEFVRLAAEQAGGSPRFLHAPYLPSKPLRDAFLADAGFQDTIALWDRVDAAIVGIGLPHAADPSQGRQVVTPDEIDLFGAVGDVIRHYFDVQGNLVPWDGENRLLAMSPAQLRAVPLVIGVAAAVAKAPAILGAARGGLVNALVTDMRTAQAILALP
ncbi:sugar-binding transcriptional regulator [Labrys monachus]|nr:sugar-binding domain-containing protein [Labrys monachus]